MEDEPERFQSIEHLREHIVLDFVIVKPRAANGAVDVCRRCYSCPHAKQIANKTLDSSYELYFACCTALVLSLALSLLKLPNLVAEEMPRSMLN